MRLGRRRLLRHRKNHPPAAAGRQPPCHSTQNQRSGLRAGSFTGQAQAWAPALLRPQGSPQDSVRRRFVRHTGPKPRLWGKGVAHAYRSFDLLWRPVGCLVRFVAIIHPDRGYRFFLTTDLSLHSLEIIALYGVRFKIEVSFKQAVHTVGTYRYHFWMMPMTSISRTPATSTSTAKATAIANRTDVKSAPTIAIFKTASLPRSCSKYFPSFTPSSSGAISDHGFAPSVPEFPLPNRLSPRPCVTGFRNFSRVSKHLGHREIPLRTHRP